MWRAKRVVKILHNAHAQKYVDLIARSFEDRQFHDECARAKDIRGAGVGLGTKLMLTIIICIRVAKVGGLSPLTMKSEGARTPPLPPLFLRP